MPNASVSMTLSFLVLPEVSPGGGAQSFSGKAKEVIAEATTALDERGVALSTTNAGAGDWSGLSVSGAVPDLLSEDNLLKLSKMIAKLQGATDILLKVAKIIELVISSFGSLSTIVKTLLSVVQTQVNNWIKDLSGVGLYFNMIVPPAFNEALAGNSKINKLSSGGFQSFVSTLGVSFNNSADNNRPIFSDQAQVGGFVLLIDSDTLDQFFKTMETFSKMFDFMEVFPFNTNPAPPRNITGAAKFDKKAGKYGVELKWKAPNVFVPMYQISRSLRSGGRNEERDIQITKLKLYASQNKWDLFKAVKYKIQTKEWPQERVRVYDDLEAKQIKVPEFKGPVQVLANALTGGGSYMDYNIKLGADGKPAQLKYFYVIQSGVGDANFGIWGPYSPQVSVPMSPACIDENQAAMVRYQDGSGITRYGFIRSGWPGFGKWASVKIKIPFLEDFAKIFSNVLESIAGMTDNVSSSFSAFLKSIKDKIDYYINMVEALIAIIQSIQALELAGRVAYLYLQIQEGGTRGFMSRLRAAQPIEGGFSGPSGITAGMVFVTGVPAFDLTVDEESEAAYGATVALKNKTFESLVQLFMSLFGGG